MRTRKILSAVGTFVIVGAVSTAGAALWTNVLDRKFQMVKVKLTHPKSDKIIFVDFRKAGRAADTAAPPFSVHKRHRLLWRNKIRR